MSPEVSEEMVDEGEVGGLSSWCEDPPGVGWSKVVVVAAAAVPAPPAGAILVRRRLEGGIIEETDGELWWSWLVVMSGLRSSWSDMSEAMEERGEPGESAIGIG